MATAMAVGWWPVALAAFDKSRRQPTSRLKRAMSASLRIRRGLPRGSGRSTCSAPALLRESPR